MNNSFEFKTIDLNMINHWGLIQLYDKIKAKNQDKQEFVFMDGPPFVSSSNLHLGHMLIFSIKSIMLNYKNMIGYHVINKIGYDCHGIPIEQASNKDLDIYTKDEIINKIGIFEYNKNCKRLVQEYSGAWDDIFRRIGRFVDFKDYYKTLDLDFMNSVWWVFSELYKKDLVYKSFRIMPFSVKCGTSFSNFEAGQNYRDVEDISAYVRFKTSDNNYLIIWTTTPWTLPSNLAVCVNPDLMYVITDMNYIIAESCLENLYPTPKKNKNYIQPYKIIKRILGRELVGLSYTFVFSIFNEQKYVISDPFVDASNGTGLVHIAPGFGEVDFDVCIKNNLVNHKNAGDYCPITDDGLYTRGVYQDMHIFDVNKKILVDLKSCGDLVKKDIHKHSYPFCWRTDTPLIYKLVSSWFINIQKIQKNMIEHNKNINFIPSSVGTNRFNNWLENTKDWGISRSRFFGTPIPVWTDENYEEFLCISNIDELKEYTDREILDLHREYIDDIKITSKKTGKILTRIPDVFDCWFESGAVPVAQYNYKTPVKQADFICEGLDQTRGWFYTLLVESVGLFDQIPFKNCICAGLVLADDNKKISKSRGNYVSPVYYIDKYGADALRLYLSGSPAAHADSFKFIESDVQIVSGKLYQFYNACKLGYEYLKKFNHDGYELDRDLYKKTDNITDLWIIDNLNNLNKNIRDNLDNYLVYKVPSILLDFIEDLTNWYIKFNRNRLRGVGGGVSGVSGGGIGEIYQQNMSLSVLYKIILDFCKLSAPFMPFLTEHIYLNYLKEDNITSIHLFDYPEYIILDNKNTSILDNMKLMQKLVNHIRMMRSSVNKSNKIPLKQVIIMTNNNHDLDLIKNYMKDEINTLELIIKDSSKDRKINISPNISILGRKYRSEANIIKKKILEQENFYKTLDPEDYVISYNYDIKLEKYQISSNLEDMLIIIDHEDSQEVVNKYLVRLFTVNIQKIRKEAGLKTWNKIKIYYNSQDQDFFEIINNNKKNIEEVLMYDINIYDNNQVCDINKNMILEYLDKKIQVNILIKII